MRSLECDMAIAKEQQDDFMDKRADTIKWSWFVVIVQ